MKPKLINVGLALLVLSALSFVNPAETGKLHVASKVKNQKGQKLGGVFISVVDSVGTVIDTMTTKNNGSYKFKLDYHQRFKVGYQLQGYKPIFIDYDTKMPDKKERFDYYYSPPEKIMIRDSLEFNDRAFAKKAMTEVRFIDALDRFDYDPELLDDYLGHLVKPNIGVVIRKGIVLDSADSPAKGVEILAESIQGEKIDQDSDGFEKDEAKNKAFETRLKTPVYDEISVSGNMLTAQSIESNQTPILSSPKVYVLAGNDTIRTLDVAEDGNFSFRAPANRNVRLAFTADSFRRTLVDVESQVSGERIEKLKTDVVLFSLANDTVNEAAFDIAAQRHFFNNVTGQFESDENVSETFAAVLSSDPSMQEYDGKLPIRGVSRDMNGQKLGGVAFTLVENGKVVLQDTTDSKGKFRFVLKLKRNYRMLVEKEGFHPFFINMNTDVPDDLTATKFNQLVPPVTLIPDTFGDILNPGGFEQKPLAEIHYSPLEKEFTDRDGVFEDLYALVTQRPEGYINQDSIQRALDSIANIVVPGPNNTFLSVKGRIQDQDNKDLKNVKVKLTQPLAGQLVFVKEVQTDRTGAYEMNLPYDRFFRLVFSDPDYYETFIELNTDVDGKYENRSIEIPAVSLYDREDETVNPMAFSQPWQQFAFDPVKATFDKNDSIPYLFTRMLNSPVATPLLSLTGRVKGNKSGYKRDVKVLVEKDTIINGVPQKIIVDSARTDRRGNYALNLPYNGKYRLSFQEDESHETFITVDTRTSLDEKDLRREQFAAPTVLIYKKDDKKVDPFAFNLAFASISYNPSSGSFFNRAVVNQNFLAKVDIGKDDEEEVPELDDVLVDTEEIEAEEIEYEEVGLNNLLQKYKDRAKQAELAANREQTMDNRYGIARSMVVEDTTDYSKLENVLLQNQSINNVLFETFRASDREDELEQAEAAAEAAERSYFIAETVNKSLRKGIASAEDLVSLDSTFVVQPPTRIDYNSTRFQVKETVSYTVRSGGQIYRYYTITNWFFFTDWYKNGVEIDEDQYLAELNNYKKLAERQ